MYASSMVAAIGIALYSDLMEEELHRFQVEA
jgi:hypothetical protein